jgi:hypothetical protein
MEEKITERNECWYCKEKREVPGNCHIRCNNPDKEMTGNSHGIKNGWFWYPSCFDPVWKTKKCDNFNSQKGSE